MNFDVHIKQCFLSDSSLSVRGEVSKPLSL